MHILTKRVVVLLTQKQSTIDLLYATITISWPPKYIIV